MNLSMIQGIALQQQNCTESILGKAKKPQEVIIKGSKLLQRVKAFLETNKRSPGMHKTHAH